MGTMKTAAVFLVVFFLLSSAFLLYAQDAGGGAAPAAGGAGGAAPAAAPQHETTFFELLEAGGTVGWFIVLLSVAMVALIIEHFVSIRRDKLIPPEIVVELETLLEEEQYEEAMTLCESSRNYLTAALGAALAHVGDGHDKMVEAACNAMDEENLKLNQKISYLGLIGNTAPMLGLLGTVTGMIGAFMVIAASSGAPSPAQLAGGIYQALVTTVQGLVVGIPALFFLFYFKNRVAKLTFELGSVTLEFVDKFKNVSMEAPQK